MIASLSIGFPRDAYSVKKLCVEWGRTNTGWPINVNYVKNFCTHVKCGQMEIWECLMGGAFMIMVSVL